MSSSYSTNLNHNGGIHHGFNEKNVNLTNEELEMIQGGANSYGKEANNHYPWEMASILTLPVHGFCPSVTYDLGYIGGGNHLCKGSAARF